MTPPRGGRGGGGSRPLVLLPPSKAKADGGTGPAYRASLAPDHPLATARTEVLDAVEATVPDLDDRAVQRLTGVRHAHLAQARRTCTRLGALPTWPAHRRYAGIVHRNAGLAERRPDRLDVDVLLVSALLGVVRLDEPVPAYRLEFAATVPGLGTLASFWRGAAGPHLLELARDRIVWDLLPGEHQRIWPPGARDVLDHRPVAFRRPDGRAANAARTKVAKGRLAAWLLAHPAAAHEGSTVAAQAQLGPGWSLGVDGPGLRAIDTGG